MTAADNQTNQIDAFFTRGGASLPRKKGGCLSFCLFDMERHFVGKKSFILCFCLGLSLSVHLVSCLSLCFVFAYLHPNHFFSLVQSIVTNKRSLLIFRSESSAVTALIVQTRPHLFVMTSRLSIYECWVGESIARLRACMRVRVRGIIDCVRANLRE